jgi:hypothetical protein
MHNSNCYYQNEKTKKERQESDNYFQGNQTREGKLLRNLSRKQII